MAQTNLWINQWKEFIFFLLLFLGDSQPGKCLWLAVAGAPRYGPRRTRISFQEYGFPPQETHWWERWMHRSMMTYLCRVELMWNSRCRLHSFSCVLFVHWVSISSVPFSCTSENLVEIFWLFLWFSCKNWGLVKWLVKRSGETKIFDLVALSWDFCLCMSAQSFILSDCLPVSPLVSTIMGSRVFSSFSPVWRLPYLLLTRQFLSLQLSGGVFSPSLTC